MEIGSYKIQTRIEQAEFSAEGEGDFVRADYDRFLRALESRPAENGVRAKIGDTGGSGVDGSGDVETTLGK